MRLVVMFDTNTSPALRCLVPSLRLGMPNERLRLKTSGRAAIDLHFQPEAGNEVLKRFWLKLTPMSSAVPLPSIERFKEENSKSLS